jgi:hypothetical protein
MPDLRKFCNDFVNAISGWKEGERAMLEFTVHWFWSETEKIDFHLFFIQFVHSIQFKT